MVSKFFLLVVLLFININISAQHSLSFSIIRRSLPLSLKDSPSSFGTNYPFLLDTKLFKTGGIGLAYNYTLPKKMFLNLQLFAAKAVFYDISLTPNNIYEKRFLARVRGDLVLNIGKKFILHKKYFDIFYILAGVGAMNIGTNFYYSKSSAIPTKNYNYFF